MINTYKLLASSVVVIVFSGCSTTPNELELNYGKAYRNMVAEQIYNPDAAINPPTNPPEKLDGDRASDVLEKYRIGNKNQKQAPAVSIQLGK